MLLREAFGHIQKERGERRSEAEVAPDGGGTPPSTPMIAHDRSHPQSIATMRNQEVH
jgi:hypothetical protein